MKSVKDRIHSVLSGKRRHGEERLLAKSALVDSPRNQEENQRLVHELEHCRIELEMQNAELRLARSMAETTLEKYSDLYDFAPVGYFTLDRDGVILAANLAGAGLLGIDRARLIGLRFGPFVTWEFRSVYTDFLGKVFENQGKEACELTLTKEGKHPLHLQIEAVASASAAECRIAAIDISARKEAEDESRNSEKRYSSLFKNMHEGFAYCRMLFDKNVRPEDFVYIEVNSAFERLTGLKNVAGKRVTEVIPGIKEAHPELFEIYGRVALTGRPETLEMEFKSLGIWLSISVYSMERDRFVAVFENITVRKLAEAVLLESERRYSSLFNNRHVAMLLIEPETGKILTANPAACAFYGYNSTQFSTLKISDINSLPKPDIELEMEQALNMQNSLFHFRHRLANGEIRDVEVHSGPIEFKDQKLLYSIVHDVSERKLMEEKLRRSERQLAEAQALAHLGSWVWDSIGDELSGSDEFNRIFGQELSSYDSFIELVHPGDRERVNLAVQETLASQVQYDVHYRIIRPDGNIRAIHARGVAVTDDAGRTIRMVGTCQDVSERREMEAKLEILNAELAARATELEAANSELAAFNRNISHGLRRPLTVINGYSQVVQELCSDRLDEHSKGYIREIFEGTLHMNRLIDTLQEFSRVSHDEMQPDVVDLSMITEEVALGLKVSEPKRKVTFRIAAGILAHGDAGQLRVVLENLIGNSWKHSVSQEWAVIEFGATEVDGIPAYFVRDNGSGFDMAEAGKLFIPFQRFPVAEEFIGYGIGLATVERVVKRHGGMVWAEGEPGKGASFYFTLSVNLAA